MLGISRRLVSLRNVEEVYGHYSGDTNMIWFRNIITMLSCSVFDATFILAQIFSLNCSVATGGYHISIFSSSKKLSKWDFSKGKFGMGGTR